MAQTVTAGTAPSNSVAVDPATNRISTTGYGYDASGNMTNDGVNNLTYDAENHVVSGSGSGTYTYDDDGHSLRVEKVSGSTTTVYIFSGSKVIAEYDNGAAPSREYVYSGGALLAKIDSSGTKYYHQDQLSNRLVSDASGNTSAQLGHYPYGESWYNATSDKLLFTTYERDAESGNDYAMARYDVNRLGRFASPDPLAGDGGDPQSLNRYPYTANDPIDFVDPAGMNRDGPGVCSIAGDSCAGGGEPGGSFMWIGIWWEDSNEQLIRVDWFFDVLNLGSPNSICGPIGCLAGPKGPPPPPQKLVNCDTLLPNGETVGDVVRQQQAALHNAMGIGTNIDNLPTIRLLATFASVASPGGPIDFKNNFKGQADPNLLGQAGNFAYYAIGSAYFPTFALDAGATGYAILAHGSLWSPNAQVVRSNALAAKGCK